MLQLDQLELGGGAGAGRAGETVGGVALVAGQAVEDFLLVARQLRHVGGAVEGVLRVVGAEDGRHRVDDLAAHALAGELRDVVAVRVDLPAGGLGLERRGVHFALQFGDARLLLAHLAVQAGDLLGVPLRLEPQLLQLRDEHLHRILLRGRRGRHQHGRRQGDGQRRRRGMRVRAGAPVLSDAPP